MVKRFIYLFLFLVNVLNYGQALRVKASTDTTEYKVGDAVNYTLTIEYDKKIGIIPPQIKDSLKGVEVLQILPPVTTEDNDKKITVIKAVVSRYDSSVVTIPPIAIKYKMLTKPDEKLSDQDTTLKKILSYPVTFSVHTVKVNTQAEIKDVKNPESIPYDWRLILLWIMLALLLGIGGWYLYKWNQKRKAGLANIPKEIILPPHVEALNALKELEEKQLWQKGMVKEYHSEITEIIRTYFEKKFNLPALELTTTEVNLQLSQIRGTGTIIDITNEFLNNADLVKFAKFKPENSVNAEMMKQAVEIVNRTIENIPEEVSNV
jgi:hypothetical protein